MKQMPLPPSLAACASIIPNWGEFAQASPGSTLHFRKLTRSFVTMTQV